MVPERAENSTHHGIGGAAEALTKATSFKLRKGKEEIAAKGVLPPRIKCSGT
jgi:hypothetical protein